MITAIKNVANKLKYGAKVISWLADSLASFPTPPETEGDKSGNVKGNTTGTTKGSSAEHTDATAKPEGVKN